MKITVVETISDYTYESLEITLDGETKFHVFSSDSPEDNTLSRNFADCYDIPELLRKAYKAGLNGEEFEVEYDED
jgi:hypothetical protein